jgi:tetratricopeptide (TPR) repeat protein
MAVIRWWRGLPTGQKLLAQLQAPGLRDWTDDPRWNLTTLQEKVRQYRLTILTGPAGAGKSHWLTHQPFGSIGLSEQPAHGRMSEQTLTYDLASNGMADVAEKVLQRLSYDLSQQAPENRAADQTPEPASRSTARPPSTASTVNALLKRLKKSHAPGSPEEGPLLIFDHVERLLLSWYVNGQEDSESAELHLLRFIARAVSEQLARIILVVQDDWFDELHTTLRRTGVQIPSTELGRHHFPPLTVPQGEDLLQHFDGSLEVFGVKRALRRFRRGLLRLCAAPTPASAGAAPTPASAGAAPTPASAGAAPAASSKAPPPVAASTVSPLLLLTYGEESARQMPGPLTKRRVRALFEGDARRRLREPIKEDRLLRLGAPLHADRVRKLLAALEARALSGAVPIDELALTAELRAELLEAVESALKLRLIEVHPDPAGRPAKGSSRQGLPRLMARGLLFDPAPSPPTPTGRWGRKLAAATLGLAVIAALIYPRTWHRARMNVIDEGMRCVGRAAVDHPTVLPGWAGALARAGEEERAFDVFRGAPPALRPAVLKRILEVPDLHPPKDIADEVIALLRPGEAFQAAQADYSLRLRIQLDEIEARRGFALDTEANTLRSGALCTGAWLPRAARKTWPLEENCQVPVLPGTSDERPARVRFARGTLQEQLLALRVLRHNAELLEKLRFDSSPQLELLHDLLAGFEASPPYQLTEHWTGLGLLYCRRKEWDRAAESFDRAFSTLWTPSGGTVRRRKDGSSATELATAEMQLFDVLIQALEAGLDPARIRLTEPEAAPGAVPAVTAIPAAPGVSTVTSAPAAPGAPAATGAPSPAQASAAAPAQPLAPLDLLEDVLLPPLVDPATKADLHLRYARLLRRAGRTSLAHNELMEAYRILVRDETSWQKADPRQWYLLCPVLAAELWAQGESPETRRLHEELLSYSWLTTPVEGLDDMAKVAAARIHISGGDWREEAEAAKGPVNEGPRLQIYASLLTERPAGNLDVLSRGERAWLRAKKDALLERVDRIVSTLETKATAPHDDGSSAP